MTESGLRRGSCVLVQDTSLPRGERVYAGTGTVHGVEYVFFARPAGMRDGRQAIEVEVHDTPVDPNEPMPEWMRDEREKLGLETPRRELAKKLVDDEYPF